MNVIEKKYRLLTIREDIEAVDAKVFVIDTDGVGQADHDRLMSASWHLQRAVQLIQSVSLSERSSDLCRILQVSIDGIRGGTK